MNKMRGESAWVAELVSTSRNRESHGEIVAFGEAKKQVLHGGAGSFVRLEENHIGVLDPRASGNGGAAKVEGLYVPAPVSSLVQQQTDGADDHEEQKYLLLPHFYRICGSLFWELRVKR